MEDKVFDLMTRFYNEFTEFRKETQEGFLGVKNDIIQLENKVDNNSKALFDGYKQTYEKLLELEDKVDDISARLDGQEVEIKVLRGVK